jgi:hypothetical protein
MSGKSAIRVGVARLKDVALPFAIAYPKEKEIALLCPSVIVMKNG